MNSIDIFPWNDNFNTGLPVVDAQHRTLVDLLNDLASQVAFQADVVRLSDIFDALADYADYHFRTEEEIWHTYLSGDAVVHEHEATHGAFMNAVVRLRANPNNESLRKVAEDALTFLARWLASHILESDRHMAYLVQALTAGQSMEEAKHSAALQMSGATKALTDIILSIYGTLTTNTLNLMRELAERTHMEDQLRESENFNRRTLDAISAEIAVLDADGTITDVNQAWLNFGREPGMRPGHCALCADVGSNYLALLKSSPGDADAQRALEGIQAVMRGQRSEFSMEYACHCTTQRRWFNMHINALVHQGRTGVVVVHTDISARKSAEEGLQQAASVFTFSGEGIFITNLSGEILKVNESFSRITGYSCEAVIGQNAHILSSGRQGKGYYAALWESLQNKGHWYGEIWNRRKNGEVYAEMLKITAVRDASGVTQHYVALFSDITSMKEHQKQLEHIAHFDSLTGLPNRVVLADRLRQAMATALRRGLRVGVAFLDLDGFKSINDKHGHQAGDLLLIDLAGRMKQALRDGDTLTRLGGDEFVAVLLDLDDVSASVPILNRLLQAAAHPLTYGAAQLKVSASLGVTFYPQGEEVDADQLLRQADQSMYQAKLAGRNRFHIFDAEQDRHIRGVHESLEQIQRALTEQQLVLYYQPKVNMRTSAVVGVEALIRWNHPQRGLLGPDDFLHVTEDSGLAVAIGEWVIDTALAQIEAWHAIGLHLRVAVNVGARQLQAPDFVQVLGDLLAAHPGVQPGDLELEVLETSALNDIERVCGILDACAKLGVQFALDDFGTGYSSLTYLRRLPVSTLKIDQSFVRNMLNNADDLAILEGVLGLAAAFQRKVIAEGVENLESGRLLLLFGCELAQGFAIARPMPADQLPSWVRGWKSDPTWFDQSPVGRDNLPLVFASVEHRAWIVALEQYLQDGRRYPPPLDRSRSRFAAWLEDSNPTKVLSPAAIASLEQVHRRLHLLAAELVEIKSQGGGEQALVAQRMHELLTLSTTLNDDLQHLLIRRQRSFKASTRAKKPRSR